MNLDKNSSFVDSIPKPILLLIIVPFTILTIIATRQFGLIGIFKEGLQNSATTQILLDLVICAFFFIVWLRQDALRMNRNFPFWLVITLAFGSFGPLLYLLTRKTNHSKKTASN